MWQSAADRQNTKRSTRTRRTSFCLLGATNEKLADFFGVSGKTIDNWIRDVPEFLRALKKGRDDADARVADSLFNRALGYKHRAVKIFQAGGTTIEHAYTEHYPPDPTSCIFWLKNRQPAQWRDKPVQEDSEKSDEMLKQLADAIRNSPQ